MGLGINLLLFDCYQVVEGMSTPVDLANEDALLKAAATSLNSKVVSQHSTILAPIAVQAIRAGMNMLFHVCYIDD